MEKLLFRGKEKKKKNPIATESNLKKSVHLKKKNNDLFAVGRAKNNSWRVSKSPTEPSISRFTVSC